MSTPIDQTLLTVVAYPDPVPGKYIVVLKDGIKWLDYPYSGIILWNLVLNGFCATLSQTELDDLRASPDVEAIYQDGYAQVVPVDDNVPLIAEEINALRDSVDADTTLEAGQHLHQEYTHLSQEALKEACPVTSNPEGAIYGTQYNAPWGLQRIIQPGRLANWNDGALNFNYSWDDRAGFGVDVYVIDTGVYYGHPQFGGRARWGATFGGYPDRDDNGHGTHCAGIIGSNQFGVAKMVNIIAVKVLGADGRGPWSDIISGMEWVARSAANTGRPSIASMSVYGPAYRPVDQAAEYLTYYNIHLVVCAGNNNTDAITQSPARVPSAITVGATNIYDARSGFSNYGSVLDIFAPGENVISTLNYGEGSKSMSGTSMACPHVAGTLALLISIFGNNIPANWQAWLKNIAVKNVLINLPFNTPNLLLQVT